MGDYFKSAFWLSRNQLYYCFSHSNQAQINIMVGQKLSAIRKKYEISEHNFGKIAMESRDQARKIKVECFRAIWSVAEHFKGMGHKF